MSDPPGRPVWILNRYLGVTPTFADSVSKDAILRIGERSGGDAWCRPWSFRPGAARDTVRFGAFQRLRIVTRPSEARIRIDGVDEGESPLILLVPAAGKLRVEASAPAGLFRQLDYEPSERSDSTLALSLAGVPAPSAGDAVPVGLRVTTTRIVFPVAAVVLGVTGVLARRTADRAYDGYLATVDRTKMAQQWDRARNADHLSEGALIGSEVFMAASVLVWIREPRPVFTAEVSADGTARVGVRLDALLARWNGRTSRLRG